MEKRVPTNEEKKRILFGTINIYLYRFIILHLWVFYLFLEFSFFKSYFSLYCFHWTWFYLMIGPSSFGFFLIKFIKRNRSFISIIVSHAFTRWKEGKRGKEQTQWCPNPQIFWCGLLKRIQIIPAKIEWKLQWNEFFAQCHSYIHTQAPWDINFN